MLTNVQKHLDRAVSAVLCFVNLHYIVCFWTTKSLFWQLLSKINAAKSLESRLQTALNDTLDQWCDIGKDTSNTRTSCWNQQGGLSVNVEFLTSTHADITQHSSCKTAAETANKRQGRRKYKPTTNSHEFNRILELWLRFNAQSAYLQILKRAFVGQLCQHVKKRSSPKLIIVLWVKNRISATTVEHSQRRLDGVSADGIICRESRLKQCLEWGILSAQRARQLSEQSAACMTAQLLVSLGISIQTLGEVRAWWRTELMHREPSRRRSSQEIKVCAPAVRKEAAKEKNKEQMQLQYVEILQEIWN